MRDYAYPKHDMKRQLDVTSIPRDERDRLMRELTALASQDCAIACASIPFDVWKRIWRKANRAEQNVYFTLARVCSEWIPHVDDLIRRTFRLKIVDADRILRRFTHLCDLSLPFQHGITEDGLACMVHLTRLVYNTKILDKFASRQGSGLATLTQLRSLTLGTCCCVDGDRISGLTNLTVRPRRRSGAARCLASYTRSEASAFRHWVDSRHSICTIMTRWKSCF